MHVGIHQVRRMVFDNQRCPVPLMVRKRENKVVFVMQTHPVCTYWYATRNRAGLVHYSKVCWQFIFNVQYKLVYFKYERCELLYGIDRHIKVILVVYGRGNYWFSSNYCSMFEMQWSTFERIVAKDVNFNSDWAHVFIFSLEVWHRLIVYSSYGHAHISDNDWFTSCHQASPTNSHWKIMIRRVSGSGVMHSVDFKKVN